MKKDKIITLISVLITISSLMALAFVWIKYQRATTQTSELTERVTNYNALIYSEMETCRTILGCYVDDPGFCATDAYTEKIIELGKKTEAYRTKLGDEVTTRPEGF